MRVSASCSKTRTSACSRRNAPVRTASRCPTRTRRSIRICRWPISCSTASSVLTSERLSRRKHAELRDEPDQSAAFLVRRLIRFAELRELVFVFVRRDGEAVGWLQRRIGRHARPRSVPEVIGDVAARPHPSRLPELREDVRAGGRAALADRVRLLRREHLPDERRHHVLQPLLGVADSLDEMHRGVCDDAHSVAARPAHFAAPNHFAEELDVFAHPAEREVETLAGRGEAVVLDECAADADVEDQRALFIELRKDWFRQSQALEFTAVIGDHWPNYCCLRYRMSNGGTPGRTTKHLARRSG